MKIKPVPLTTKPLTYAICAGVSIFYAVASLAYGTPNFTRWNEVRDETQEKIEVDTEYSELYDKAIECVDRDFHEGLSLAELGELYDRSNVVMEFDPTTGNFKFPKLTKKDLEFAVISCNIF